MCFTADLHLINILGKNLWGHIISFVLTANGNLVHTVTKTQAGTLKEIFLVIQIIISSWRSLYKDIMWMKQAMYVTFNEASDILLPF